MKSYMNSSENVVPFITLGAAVAVSLAYILWNPGPGSPKKSGKRRKVAGLENLGNTCYLNTILQSLAACPTFLAWLNRALRRGCFKGRGSELAYKLSKTLEGVNDYSSSQIYSPHEVLYALYSRNWRPGQEQQDAHELFQFLLSELSEDREQAPSPLPLSEAPKLVKHVSNGVVAPTSGLRSSIKANLPRVTNRDVDSSFRGLLANHLTCTSCGHKNAVTYTSFDCLSLPIPSLALFNTLSLNCILDKFTQAELVQGVECVECTKRKKSSSTTQPKPHSPEEGRAVEEPREGVTRGQGDGSPGGEGSSGEAGEKEKRIFQKQMTICKLPMCLCIHIQRVGWQANGLPFRREEHIIFPEVLDMSSYRHASVIATCNNTNKSITRALHKAQEMPLVNGQPQKERRQGHTPSHTFIGDSFLSPTRPASIRLVGGGWVPPCPPEDEQEGTTDEEGEGTTMEEERSGLAQDGTSQNSKPAESKYKLASAVVHVGNAFSGHFMTYRRGPSKPGETLNKNWLCVSDESVYTAQLPDVLSQKAYMLYYQRE